MAAPELADAWDTLTYIAFLHGRRREQDQS
jgi:hypothetical protein